MSNSRVRILPHLLIFLWDDALSLVAVVKVQQSHADRTRLVRRLKDELRSYTLLAPFTMVTLPMTSPVPKVLQNCELSPFSTKRIPLVVRSIFRTRCTIMFLPRLNTTISPRWMCSATTLDISTRSPGLISGAMLPVLTANQPLPFFV